MQAAEISQKEIVTLKTTNEGIDLRKHNQSKQKTKGATLEDILDPDAPDEMEVEDNLISPTNSIRNTCKYADIKQELKEESFGFNLPLAHFTFKTNY